MDIGAIRAKIELDTKRFNESVESVRNQTRNLTSEVGSASSEVKKLGLAFGAVTAALGALTAASIKTAANFEQSMSRVQAVTGATAEEFTQLRDLAIELGASTVYSASQAADGISYLAMAGFKANDILAAMPNVLSLAAAGQMDLARAADISSNVLSSFNLEASEMARVSDVMASAMSKANTNIEQLGTAFKYVAPVAASVGLSIEETAAAVGKLSDQGLQGEQAGTILRAMLLRLINPTGEAAKLVEKLGINVQTANGQLKSMPDIIANVSKAFDGLTNSQRAEYAATLVGMEATSGFLALLSTGADELRAFTTELENATGAANEMAKIQTDNLNGAITELKSALESVQITVGDKFAPSIRKVAEGLTKLALGFEDLDAPTQNAILTFTSMATVGGTATASIYALITALNALKVSLRAFAIASGVIGAAALAIGGLTAAYSYLKTKQDEAAEASRRNEERIRELVKEYDSLSSALRVYEEGSDEAIDASDRLKSILEELRDLAPDVVDAFNKQEGAIKSMTAATGQAIKENIKLLQSQLALLEADTRGIEEIGASGVAERSANIINLRQQIDELKNKFWERANDSFYDDWRQMAETAEEMRRLAGAPPPADEGSNYSPKEKQEKTKKKQGKTREEILREMARHDEQYLQYKRGINQMSMEQEVAYLERMKEKYKEVTDLRHSLAVTLFSKGLKRG